MNSPEAYHILQLANSADIEDVFDRYEEILFETKNYFIQKIAIEKLFSRKIAYLKEVEQAVFTLTNTTSNSPVKVEIQAIEEVEIQAQFKAFQAQKNKLKTQLFQSDSASEIREIANFLVKLEKENARVWAIEMEKDDSIIISKEPDPMQILEAIQDYQSHGGKTFMQLKNLENNPPQVLIHEMKRLSLLFKHY